MDDFRGEFLPPLKRQESFAIILEILRENIGDLYEFIGKIEEFLAKQSHV